jgi:hypothetical protein
MYSPDTGSEVPLSAAQPQSNHPMHIDNRALETIG